MSEIKKAVSKFETVRRYYNLPSIPAYTGEAIRHDFGRNVGIVGVEFWSEYYELLTNSDGLAADGVYFFGINCEKDLRAYRLIENNRALSEPGLEAPGFERLIYIGTSNTDSFVYNTSNQKWESRDRIGTDTVYESHDSLAELLNFEADKLVASLED